MQNWKNKNHEAWSNISESSRVVRIEVVLIKLYNSRLVLHFSEVVRCRYFGGALTLQPHRVFQGIAFLSESEAEDAARRI